MDQLAYLGWNILFFYITSRFRMWVIMSHNFLLCVHTKPYLIIQSSAILTTVCLLECMNKYAGNPFCQNYYICSARGRNLAVILQLKKMSYLYFIHKFCTITGPTFTRIWIVSIFSQLSETEEMQTNQMREKHWLINQQFIKSAILWWFGLIIE